jgi:hypothetical protein
MRRTSPLFSHPRKTVARVFQTTTSPAEWKPSIPNPFSPVQNPAVVPCLTLPELPLRAITTFRKRLFAPKNSSNLEPLVGFEPTACSLRRRGGGIGFQRVENPEMENGHLLPQSFC